MANAVWGRVELRLEAAEQSDNPYVEQTVQVEWECPGGEKISVPGYWNGGREWGVRFAPDQPGEWKWRSFSEDAGLNGRCGTVAVQAYEGSNPLYRHGFLQAKERGFFHRDGTPFFWLGDTVWAAPALARPEEWRDYVRYRSGQGYNVAQMNSLIQWDGAEGELRLPFVRKDGGAEDYSRIRPEYFRYLDGLMEEAADSGIVPALVVLWFNYVPETNLSWGKTWNPPMSLEEAERYAAYLGARYAAYGTVWLISGDTDYGTAPAYAYYDAAARAVRQASPYPALMTAHLNGGLFTPEALNGKDWLDFHMLQSCHCRDSADRALRFAERDRAYSPARPVLNGEPCYEGLRMMDADNTDGLVFTREQVRETAWTSVLGGANAGFTYGVHGLWPWHREGLPYGHMNYGLPYSWEEALRLESGEDMARMKRLLVTLPWWELEPRDGVRQAASDGAGVRIQAAAVPGDRLLAVYVGAASDLRLPLAADRPCAGTWFDPSTGDSEPARLKVLPGGEGWLAERARWAGDAVLVVERQGECGPGCVIFHPTKL